MCNVKMSMKIEDVKINKITYVSDTCLKRGNRISWSAIQEDKRHIKDNKVTYLVEVNNSYRKEVTFEFCQVTTKLTNNDNIRRQYTEVVMEDVDGEFGKIICTTSDVKNATTTLKNKMTVEYRKTYAKQKEHIENMNGAKEEIKNLKNTVKCVVDQRDKLKDKNTQLMKVNTEYKYEIMKLEKTIEELQSKTTKELTLRDMIMIGKLYTKKVLKLKSDEEFEKEVRKYLKH